MSGPAETRLAELEERVGVLEKALLPPPKGKPILVSKEGVCGVNPECDSAKCKDASLWRYQQTCRGTACVEVYRNYHRDYRAKQRG